MTECALGSWSPQFGFDTTYEGVPLDPTGGVVEAPAGFLFTGYCAQTNSGAAYIDLDQPTSVIEAIGGSSYAYYLNPADWYTQPTPGTLPYTGSGVEQIAFVAALAIAAGITAIRKGRTR